jgi:hypothetical protein
MARMQEISGNRAQVQTEVQIARRSIRALRGSARGHIHDKSDPYYHRNTMPCSTQIFLC